jgi:MtN3 and saliva related transmembrane protein
LKTALAVTAAGWAVLMALSPLLQIRAVIRSRSSRDVSIGYFAVLLVGFGLWVAYGWAIGNLALIIPNILAFVICVVTIGIAARFR